MNITNNTITLQIDDVTYETVETDPHWGIEMKFKKHYTPSRNGRLILYLCNELVDLNREITVTANGKQGYFALLFFVYLCLSVFYLALAFMMLFT